MSAIVARIPALIGGLLALVAGLLGLPDLDQIRRLLERIQEMLALGGMAFALLVSLGFIFAWVLTHLRRPKAKAHPVLPTAALWLSYVPVLLTIVAAVGTFIPLLSPYVLKAFALAVLAAALVWSVAVAAVMVGGRREDLRKARKALLLAGTPWYCLAVWLSTFL